MSSRSFHDYATSTTDPRRRSFAASVQEGPPGMRCSERKQLKTPVLHDDGTFVVEDDHVFSMFQKGRDYEPVYVTHQYTDQEKHALNSFESCDLLPSHSIAYKHWVKRQLTSKLEIDRWMMMGLIGFGIGLLGFLLHQLIEKIGLVKWDTTKEYFHEGSVWTGWLFCSGYSMAFAVFAAGIVVLWQPIAGGSGLPEVTGFLNGTQVEHIFKLKTMVAKFLSCVAAIGCGMPIGPEGPMIHLGAIVGAGVSQMTSDVFHIRLPFFERFRNPEDKRNFITAGVAAGVSAAFGAPVGGLLFAMEEVSSFWSITLSWQIFFCCIIATFTSDIFNSSFEGFTLIGLFGEFRTSRYILFNIDEGVDINLLMFIPSALIGVIGGLLGSLFTILNLKITRVRKRKLASITRPWLVKLIKLIEPALIMLIMSSLSIFLPTWFPCVPFTCVKGDTEVVSKHCINDTQNDYNSEVAQNDFYTCQTGTYTLNGTTLYYNGTYNELALLLFSTKDNALKDLYLRNAHDVFGYASLFTALIIFFFMVCWAAGTSVAAGILVPMLLIGALYGRIIGLAIVDMFGYHAGDSYWKWMDPGAFALIGSASFFGGVARLAPAITVIMMELTNDLKVLLPVMTSVMVAKWVGDFFTHPFFHALLELKCIPFLNQQPNITVDKKSVNLELFCAGDIMAFPVLTLNTVTSVPKIATVLLDHQHNGFPVVELDKDGKKVFYGLITRSELLVILEHHDIFHEGLPPETSEEDVDIAPIGYEKMVRGTGKKTFKEVDASLELYAGDLSLYRNFYVDLRPYVNQSAMSVPTKFSLSRAYTLISALGLRHLTVVDSSNQVKGIITRKDLMGFHLVEVLAQLMETREYYDSSSARQSPQEENSNGNNGDDGEIDIDDEEQIIERHVGGTRMRRVPANNEPQEMIQGYENPIMSNIVELNHVVGEDFS